MNDIEKRFREKINGNILVQKNVGRYWTCEFSESGALTCLRTSNEVFERYKDGTFGSDDPDKTYPQFAKKNEDGTFDCIFLCFVYAPGERTDQVVASGFQVFEMIPGGETPFNPPTIAWKLK